MFGWLKRASPGPHQARLTLQQTSVVVADDQTLLQAALCAGLEFPHSCRVGSCTRCRCRLVAGEIQALTDSSYVLTAEQRRSGMILACQTRLRGDVEIEIALDRLASPVPAE